MVAATPSGGIHVVAAVDIGSNTIKMSIARQAEANANGFEELASGSHTVRLGAGLAETGRLADDRIASALETLTAFAGEARRHGATRLVGVATAATRQAANGPEFLASVANETGWDVRVVSGDEEAALTFRGLASEHDLSGIVVVADIGGGSTEVIVAEHEVIRSSQSLPLGSGALTERFVVSDPPATAELDACATAAIDALTVIDWPAAGGRAHLIVVGGTAEAVAKLLPPKAPVTRTAIEQAIATCRDLSSTELSDRFELPPARARVLPAGLTIIAELARMVAPDRISLARSAIRSGLLLATFDDLRAQTSAPTSPSSSGGD
ncbi:MAG TPA: hypothetical protein VFQ54_01640 [Thermomicrobiales bacterium]|nr:hypothetical protein [Thermomicrobiales bacterium]